MTIKTRIVSSVGAMAHRHVAVLPEQARDESDILRLATTYRVEHDRLTASLLEPGSGQLALTLLGYEGHTPNRVLWHADAVPYPGPCAFAMDLAAGDVTLAGTSVGRFDPQTLQRRFCWRFVFTAAGCSRSRITGHYQVRTDPTVDESYYAGDNYVDYEQQTDHGIVIDLLAAHGARSPVLEVGCATGGLMVRLLERGYDACGMDESAWALDQARRRVPADRVVQCRLGSDSVPDAVGARAPFGTIVLWAVLEHFADPFATVALLTRYAAPDALMFINTTNADSFTHRMLGEQWEGYVDWTHRGVDLVSTTRLREELPRLGWEIVSLETSGVWTMDADPTAATLREWWVHDARFRRFVSDRDLGDYVTCIARRTAR